jgi:hypothetical protein
MAYQKLVSEGNMAMSMTDEEAEALDEEFTNGSLKPEIIGEIVRRDIVARAATV